jgi:hypothetical protein
MVPLMSTVLPVRSLTSRPAGMAGAKMTALKIWFGHVPATSTKGTFPLRAVWTWLMTPSTVVA